MQRLDTFFKIKFHIIRFYDNFSSLLNLDLDFSNKINRRIWKINVVYKEIVGSIIL